MTERQQRAQELHGKGYNCAQSVACAYCDLVGLDAGFSPCAYP